MNKIITSHPLLHDRMDNQFKIELPAKCPYCNIALSEIPLDSYHVDLDDCSNSDSIVYSIFFCPHCEKCFLVEYLALCTSNSLLGNGFIKSMYPFPTETSTFSENICKISPKFIEIYQQSETAENQNLTEICGMGYRKALEFLIKDFASTAYPEQKSQIESTPLSKCISQYVDNERIKTLATASAWLGNDETHYVRKHLDYNLEDLKRFIKTVVAYIEFELNYDEASVLLSKPQ